MAIQSGLGGGIPGYEPDESNDDSGGDSSDSSDSSDTIELTGSPGNVSVADDSGGGSSDDPVDDPDPSGANDTNDSDSSDDNDVDPVGNARDRDTDAEQHGENFAQSFASVGSGLVDKAQNFVGGSDSSSEPDPSGANETETDSDGSNTTETDDEETRGAANTPDEDVIRLTGSPGNVSRVGGDDEDGGDPSGANETSNDFNPNRQTLGTGSIDSTADEVNVTEETDEGSSSPAGGAGVISAVSRFTGVDESTLSDYEEQGGNAEDVSQKVSDQFTEVSRQADEAGVDVDTTEILGDSADSGTNVVQDLIEGVESEIQSTRSEGTAQNDASNMDPSGANNGGLGGGGAGTAPGEGGTPGQEDAAPGEGGTPGQEDPLPGNSGGSGAGNAPGGAGPPSQAPPWAGGPGGADGEGKNGSDGGSTGGVLDTPGGKAAAVGGVGAIGLGVAWYYGLI